MTQDEQTNLAATSPTNCEAVRAGDWLGDNGEEDWRDSPEYQDFLEVCAKECRCTHSICDGVLAGGLCDEIIEDDSEEDDYPRDEDDDY